MGVPLRMVPVQRRGWRAFALGRAIVTTDAPGCRETVVDGESGFLVPVRSVDGLVAAMERLIADPGLVGRMGSRSREIAEAKYDVHAVNRVMLEAMGIEERMQRPVQGQAGPAR